MSDNFDLRKFISENRVGPYIRTEGNDLPPAPSDEETAANQVTEEKQFKVGDKVTFQYKGQTVGGKITQIVGLNARVHSEYLPTKETSIPFSKLTKATTQVNETSLEAMERMDGLAPIDSVKRLIAAAGKIIRDLKEEGFDEEDIYEYIIERIKLLDDQNY
jgi:hypothetical protein